MCDYPPYQKRYDYHTVYTWWCVKKVIYFMHGKKTKTIKIIGSRVSVAVSACLARCVERCCVYGFVPVVSAYVVYDLCCCMPHTRHGVCCCVWCYCMWRAGAYLLVPAPPIAIASLCAILLTAFPIPVKCMRGVQTETCIQACCVRTLYREAYAY